MIANVQALRAVAALLVVLVHVDTLAAARGLPVGSMHVFAVGVDLFFVISGFIMVYTTMRRPMKPGAFLLTRLLRIAPLYWVMTLAVFTVALVVPALLGSTAANGIDLLKSLAFIPYARADGTIAPILYVGWSLNLEMAFYLIFALALTLRPAGRGVIAGVAMLSGLVACGVVFRPVLTREIVFLTQPILLEFGAGMAMGYFHSRLPSSRIAGWLAGLAVLPALALTVYLAGQTGPGGWPWALLMAPVVILLALVAEAGGVALRARPVIVLGNASYALYLTHPFVTQAWTIGVEKLDLLSRTTATPIMIAAIVSAVVVSLFAHYWLERPLGRIADRMASAATGQRQTALRLRPSGPARD